jgi:nitrous oxidase accessory protein NosD
MKSRKEIFTMKPFCALLLMGICLSPLSTVIAWAEPPQVLGIKIVDQIVLPKVAGFSHWKVPMLGSVAQGTLAFKDVDKDVQTAKFDVAEGWFKPFIVSVPAAGQPEELLKFTVPCTDFPQRVVFRVTLQDKAGNRSEPTGFALTCGAPPAGSYDREQASIRPTQTTLTVNFWVVQDGQTTLAEGAQFKSPDAILGELSETTRTALEKQIIPELTGIWDQCGIQFQLGAVKVLKPEKILLRDGTLERLLFPKPERTINENEDRQVAADALFETMGLLKSELQKENKLISSEQLNLFIVGSIQNAKGFSITIGTNIVVVEWQSILAKPSGGILSPRSLVAVLAHTIGNNLGLRRAGEDGLSDVTEKDGSNLMAGRAVAPDPLTTQLAPVQCEIVKRRLAPSPKRINVPADLAFSSSTSPLRLAVDLAKDGDTIVVASGTYNEHIILGYRENVTLEGANRDSVTLTGGALKDTETIWVYNARNILIKGFTVKGTKNGIALSKGASATIEQNAIIDVQPTSEGADGEGIFGEKNSKATIVKNLIARNHLSGILLFDGVEATISDNQILENKPGNDGHQAGFGYGILLAKNIKATISKNTIARNVRMGVSVESQSEATFIDNRIFETKADAQGQYGYGISVSSRSTAVLEGNTINNNASYGLIFFGSQARVRKSTVSENGSGIYAADSEGAPSKVFLDETMVVGNRSLGVMVRGNSEMEIVNSRVIDQKPDARGQFGDAVLASEKAKLILTQSTISGNALRGIALFNAAQAQIKNNTITNNNSIGIQIGFSGTPNETIQVEISANTIQGNKSCGVFVDTDPGIRVTGQNNTISSNARNSNLCGETSKFPTGFGGGK